MNEVFTSIKRTPYQSFGSLMILFFTLFLALFFFNITAFFYGILGYVETRPQVIAYFKSDTKEKDILNIRTAIEQTGKASSIKYVSQKEALKIYTDLNKDNPLLVEMVSEKMLPASLEVYATKPIYLAEIATFLQEQNMIDDVNFQKSVVDKLVTLTSILRQTSFGLLAFLVIMTIIVLITTAAFKISVKREEIEVLQLIGASKSYIRWPFLLEGMFFGFASGTCAFLLYMIAYFSSLPFLTSYLNGIPQLAFYNLGQYDLYVFPPSLTYIGLSYVVVVVFGILIGYLGNYLATSKYIK